MAHILVTLYKDEATSARTAALMAKQTRSVHLSPLGALEFRNVLHLAVFRGELSIGDAALKKRLFQEDVAHFMQRHSSRRAHLWAHQKYFTKLVFDAKYNQITGINWESCAEVLNRVGAREALESGW